MVENIKCPVCGKTGILDFHNEDIKCPCCGSDLSIYRVIDKIPKKDRKFNIWVPISLASWILAIGLGIIVFINNPKKLSIKTNELTQLYDSIARLNNSLNQSEVMNRSDTKYKYVVLRGDSYWSVSKKFYGTGMRAEEIAQENGMTIETPLNVGDTLIIK